MSQFCGRIVVLLDVFKSRLPQTITLLKYNGLILDYIVLEQQDLIFDLVFEGCTSWLLEFIVTHAENWVEDWVEPQIEAIGMERTLDIHFTNFTADPAFRIPHITQCRWSPHTA